jgi:hypothetical protein
MANKTENAKRIETANNRMVAAARRLSEKFGGDVDSLTQTHKNAEMQEVLRAEALASFLEQAANGGLPPYASGDPNVPAQLPTGNAGEEPSASSEEGMAKATAAAKQEQAATDKKAQQKAADANATERKIAREVAAQKAVTSTPLSASQAGKVDAPQTRPVTGAGPQAPSRAPLRPKSFGKK